MRTLTRVGMLAALVCGGITYATSDPASWCCRSAERCALDCAGYVPPGGNPDHPAKYVSITPISTFDCVDTGESAWNHCEMWGPAEVCGTERQYASTDPNCTGPTTYEGPATKPNSCQMTEGYWGC